MRTQTTPFLIGLVLSVAPAASRADVIVDQSSGLTGTRIGSQFYPDNPSYSHSVFDDFTIGTAQDIGALTVFGREFGNPSANVSVLAGIYPSPSLGSSPIMSVTGTQVGANLVFNFGGATLPAGTYWIGAYVVRPNSAGQWQWNLRLPIGGFEPTWHNPGGGFGYGTDPVQLGDVLEEADLAFILERATPPPPCEGDADGNGVVNFADVTAVFANWGTAGPQGDADHNGVVNFADVTSVFLNWGVPCP